MQIIKPLCILTLTLAAVQHTVAQPVLRQSTMPVVCGRSSDILMELARSPFKPFISTSKGEGATWVFVDPGDGEMIVLREFGDSICFVAGGIIEKRDLSIFRDVKNAVRD